jgi:hypothetical protein
VTGADFGGVDIDLLADYIGGALTGTPEESAVAARIADDPAWQAAYASLGQGMAFVSAELGRLAPEPMPVDLGDRLDILLTTTDLSPANDHTSATDLTALTETASATDFGLATNFTAATDPASDFSPETESADTTETSPATAPTSNAALAGGEARSGEAGHLEGEAAADGPEPISDPEPIAADLAGPRQPHLALVRGEGAVGDGAQRVRETQPAPRSGRRLRWAAPIAVAAGVIAFVGFGLDYLAGRSTGTSSSDSAGGSAEVRGEAPSIPSGQTLASGTNYTHATLGNAPVQPMTAPLESPGEPGRKSAPGMAADVEGALQRLTSPSAIDECLAAITAANGAGPLSVESVDYARFAGSPAVIIRFTAANGRWAWASGPDCGTPTGDAAVLDKVPLG